MSTFIGLVAVTVMTSAGGAVHGLDGVLLVIGAVTVGTATYVLITGRESFAMIPTPKFAAGVLVVGLIPTFLGATSIDLESNPLGTEQAAPSSIDPSEIPLPTLSPMPEATTPSDEPVASPTPDPSPAIEATGAAGSARALLDTLPVKGRAPHTGYDREGQFGSPWIDVDANGCDTRNDVLQRDLSAETFDDACVVRSGILADPYTGAQIMFLRGWETSDDVQIDHVVALSNAWQTGAQQLDQESRIQLANDPLNLLAVDGPSNMQKSDGDAATWLPPNRKYWCPLVARQVSVKAKYGLWVTPPEHDAIARILDTCPSQSAF